MEETLEYDTGIGDGQWVTSSNPTMQMISMMRGLNIDRMEENGMENNVLAEEERRGGTRRRACGVRSQKWRSITLLLVKLTVKEFFLILGLVYCIGQKIRDSDKDDRNFEEWSLDSEDEKETSKKGTRVDTFNPMTDMESWRSQGSKMVSACTNNVFCHLFSFYKT